MSAAIERCPTAWEKDMTESDGTAVAAASGSDAARVAEAEAATQLTEAAARRAEAATSSAESARRAHDFEAASDFASAAETARNEAFDALAEVEQAYADVVLDPTNPSPEMENLLRDANQAWEAADRAYRLASQAADGELSDSVPSLTSDESDSDSHDDEPHTDDESDSERDESDSERDESDSERDESDSEHGDHGGAATLHGGAHGR
jgi:hypothetical protein